MSFIATVPEADATGEVAEIYSSTTKAMGYLPNHTKTFSQRPAVHEGWSALIGLARSAASITEVDVRHLRSLGLDDADIFDVAATAAARCFFSKLLDATGTQVDARFADDLGDLADQLTVGRAIAPHSA